MRQELVAAIERETKYMQHSQQGIKQYRNGYAQALGAIAAFLTGDGGSENNSGVDGLFAFAALTGTGNRGTDPAHLQRTIACAARSRGDRGAGGLR